MCCQMQAHPYYTGADEGKAEEVKELKEQLRRERSENRLLLKEL